MDAPEKIYICEIDKQEEYGEQYQYCSDMIRSSDIEYIRFDKYTALRDAADALKKRLSEAKVVIEQMPEDFLGRGDDGHPFRDELAHYITDALAHYQEVRGE